MPGQQIHFEVFTRRAGSTSFRLEMATEDRARAMETAEALLASGRALGVKVIKEILDPDTLEFRPVTLMSKGVPERPTRKAAAEVAPLCVSPQDLYTLHARQRIGVLLQAWLARHGSTAHELLHRPDLLERLEASGAELQHAIQKVAAPEAQTRRQSVHELMRHYQALIERAIARVMKDGRRGAFPDLSRETFAAACQRLAREPECVYLLGGAVAGELARCRGSAAKVERLLDLATEAPSDGRARDVALETVKQPLSEILSTRWGASELLGEDLSLGESLAALTRLAAGHCVDALIKADPSVAAFLPPLPPTAARLARCLEDHGLDSVRVALGQRVLRELTGSRRLRPGDARGEIEVLRALATVLTTASGPLLPLDDVRAAFVERSKRLVAGDFIDLLLGVGRPSLDQARDLVWLLENVTGAANKRRAAECLHAHVTSLRFETELRAGPASAPSRLARLAELQRSIIRVSDGTAECDAARDAVGALAGSIEAQADLINLLARSNGPVVERLTALLRLASGQTAPFGPAAERARIQAMRLLRTPDARQALAGSPDALSQVQALVLAARAA